MRTNTECIVDENGFALWVAYQTEKSDPFEAEPGNPNTAVCELVHTELLQVKLQVYAHGQSIIASKNLLPCMDDRMKAAIISKLTYE